jgi:predicted ATPase
VLATSRAALRLRGEREHQVHPLGLPGSGEARAVLASPSGALFAERAVAVSPCFAVDDGNALDVARLCGRLAGIPLALELAAAKVRLLHPAALLARLDTAMASSGARDLPPRQRTMQATLDWSYDLLEPDERRLFRLLGVFTGGFTLEAAEAVAEGDVLAPLERLVEHSLVRVAADGTRYDQLEPVLQYARARLGDDQVEERAARLRHARFFLALAEQQVPAYRRADAVHALATTAREEGNLEAALEAGLALDDGELTGRMCWALWLDWWLRGHLLVGRRFAERALARPLTPATRIGTLLTHAAMTFAQGDLASSGPGWDEALRLAEAEGDVGGQAHSVAGQGLVALAGEDLDAAEAAFRRAVPLAEAGLQDDQWLWTLTHVWLGTIALLRGAPAQAQDLVDTGLRAARARGDRLATYIGLFTAAQADIATGDLGRARGQLEEGILLSEETGDLANLASFVDALAVVEGAQGGYRTVAVLLGAAQGLRETVGGTVHGYYKPDEALRAATVRAARSALGADGFEDAVDEGRALEPSQVVELAVTTPAPRLRLASSTPGAA